ncbi:MAG: hypothetical protein HN477_05790 [Gammaproteobacteria bacterium]|nr:hypothetical protein [Gammaproteobacteria bacterium]MBT7678373.1 hypothetical protein [Gammaproteobacteria bacterium]
MSTLAHVFEAAGLATVALGSVRKQIESTAPPRGLICNFPLGRPLGKPGDGEFQHRVLAHAFSLLDSSEPVLDEFDDAIEDDSTEVLACPLPARSNENLHPAIDELRGLRPAYDRGISKYGNRAGTGRAIGVDELEAAIEALVRVSEGTPWKQAGIPGIPSRVAQDIRGYYETAALGLSDHIPAAWAGTNWFFDETESGKLVLAARAVMRDAGEKRPIWFYMTPGDR